MAVDDVGGHVCRAWCERPSSPHPPPPSTFPGSDELHGSLRESVPALLFILFFLKERVMYTQQLVCRGSGEDRRVTRSVFH